jgi:hypothetical protein
MSRSAAQHQSFFLILFLCTKTLLEIECITMVYLFWTDQLRARTEVQTLDHEVLQVCDLFKISKSEVKKSHQVSAILSMPIKLISGFSFF